MENDSFELTRKFMTKIKVGDSFSVYKKNYSVKCVGKWKPEPTREYKTVTLKCNENGELIKFFYFYGFEGNPRSKGRNSSIKQHGFIRDVEGILLVDVINQNNPFHDKSDAYHIAMRN
jgi:hypothetical protein